MLVMVENINGEPNKVTKTWGMFRAAWHGVFRCVDLAGLKQN